MIDVDVRTLAEKVGTEVAVSDWMTITQDAINRFAEATADRQWIHIDPDRAGRESPYKTTIAHGFLTLSLLSALLRSAVNPSGARMAVNYGLNRVRFVAPVPAGSRIRGRFTLGSVEETGGAIQAVWGAVVEREGSEKPVCVAEWVVRYYPGEG